MNDTPATPRTPVPLSAKTAFVVHLTAGEVAAPETLAGRVEHVTSGHSLRFSSMGELFGFMQRVLAQPDSSNKEKR